MDMTNKEIVEALNRLEMSGGVNQISVELCGHIITALESQTASKPTAKPTTPKVKGKTPE